VCFDIKESLFDIKEPFFNLSFLVLLFSLCKEKRKDMSNNNNNKNPIDINRLVYDINASMATESTLKKVAISNDAISNSLNGQLNTRNLNKDNDSVMVYSDVGLNTRLLTTSDEITIPSLDACITGNGINVNLISGSINLSGNSNIFSSNGDILTATAGSLNSNITNLSSLTLSSTTSSITIPALTSVKDSVSVSGNVGLVSGSSVSVSNQITGYATSANQVLTNGKLDTINTTITDKHLNKTTDSIDISGQSVVVNTISGFSLDTTTQITNENLENIINKTGDIQATIYYTEGATVWADSAPIPTVNTLDSNGWLYTNTNTGNAMNLFYFNGINEIKTLSQVTGQYAVVTNLSTKLNDSMIFGIYTKSATTFFTSRVTHSQVSSVDMVAGGKYLLYWGNVPNDIYPNLPRLEFTSVGTIGPANPSEEILSVTLNTNSSTPAGDIDISIESLGVVFDNQSRVYSLLGSPTEYETLVNINNILNNGIGISGSVSIDNFPAGITNVYIQNYPASQTINGSVNVDNFPAGITNVYIQNYPTSQTINGSVNVDNFPAGITHVFIDNFPASQTINGSVSVDNFPAGITNVYIQNYPASQTINGSVNVDNFPAGITHVFIDNFPASQTINGSVNVDNFPAGITHVFIDNFPASQTINGSVNVDNFPAGITHVFIDNFPASQTINGTVNVNTISGFAVESGGNLASIKANTDKLNSVTFTGDNLNTNVTNTVTVTNGTNLLGISGSISNTGFKVLDSNGTAIGGSSTALYTTLRDTSGSAIGVSGNPLSVTLPSGGGFDGKAYLYSGNGVTPITQTTISTKSGIDSNIINSSLNTHLYSFHNNNWVEVESAANGHLLVNASMQDGDGVSLTSTTLFEKTGLDTASNMYADSSGSRRILTCNTIGYLNTSSNIRDGTGNLLTSTDTTATTRSLDTSSCLYTTNESVRSALTSVAIGTGINAKRALDVNVANEVTLTQQPSYGISFQDPGVYPLTVQQTLNTGNLLKVYSCDVTGNPTYLRQEIQLDSIITNTSNTNTSVETVNTSIETGNTLQTTANTTLSTINGKLTTTTNDYSTVGLNVYQIYPKTLRYRMAGSSTAVQTYQFLGPEANAVYDGRNFTIGLNQLKNFNIYISPTNPTPTITKSVEVDYINSVGDRVTQTISITNVDTNILNGIVNINNLSWTPTSANGNNSGTVIGRNVAFRNQLSPYVSGAGVITVPNGYIGIISNLYFYATLGDSVMMYVRDKYNNLKTARYIEGINPTAGKTVNLGDINEPLIAGDSVYFMNVNPNSGGRFINAIVTMTAI
jgi:hypothetical protein